MTRRWVWVVALGLAGVVTGAIAVALPGLDDRLAPADIIVVPGNTVYPDGTLSPRLVGRLQAAIVAYRASHAAFIFVSGGVGREGVDEAAAMKRYLMAHAVAGERIIQDSQGVNTQATAENAAREMRARGLGTAIVATQYFHVLRTTRWLEHQGIEVVGHVHARVFDWRDAYSLVREMVALAVMAAD